MARFIARRVGYMLITLLVVSGVAFLIIQLPPGDFLTAYVAQLQAAGNKVDLAEVEALRVRYGLDQSLAVQYWKWISGIVFHGDFGQSFALRRPVAAVIGERLPLTLIVGLFSLLFSWLIALPGGIYSAVRRNSVGDYTINALNFLAMSIPGFLIALAVAFACFHFLGRTVGGVFSPAFANSGWNLGKLLDFMSHIWLPVVLIAIASTAGTLRVVRANLLDELRKPYVVTARAKGLTERRLILKYPVRIALNPFFSTVGWVLPGLVDSEVIIAQVLALPTTGPLLLTALRAQDMYLAGGILLLLCALTVVGTLLSDIVLMVADPRVRLGTITGRR
jgi:peptide/nickel transport system permease protein